LLDSLLQERLERGLDKCRMVAVARDASPCLHS